MIYVPSICNFYLLIFDMLTRKKFEKMNEALMKQKISSGNGSRFKQVIQVLDYKSLLANRINIKAC